MKTVLGPQLYTGKALTDILGPHRQLKDQLWLQASPRDSKFIFASPGLQTDRYGRQGLAAQASVLGLGLLLQPVFPSLQLNLPGSVLPLYLAVSFLLSSMVSLVSRSGSASPRAWAFTHVCLA